MAGRSKRWTIYQNKKTQIFTVVFTPLLHDNRVFALICYRQAGKEVNRRPSKIFKRINSQNLYSYKHTGRTIWSVPLGAARQLTFHTFAELGNDKRSTCCFADGLRESSFTFWSAVQGWCGKLSRDWGGPIQTVQVKWSPPPPPH